MAESTSRRGTILVSTCLVNALIWLPTSAIAVALPAIHDELGSSFTDLQWMINAYTLAVAALLVVMGRAGDLLGRRRMYIVGCVLFSVGALLAAAAQSTGWLIASVSVAGVGAAIAGPTSLALVFDAFTGGAQGRAIGLWGAASGLGAAVGPAVGGALTDAIDWRAVFWINAPLVLAAVGMIVVASRGEDDPRQAGRIDFPGATTLGAGLIALVLAVMQGGVWGWGSPGVIALLAAAAILATTFVVIDLRVEVPLVPFREFAHRAFTCSSIVLLIGNVVLASLLFILPLYLQNVLDRSALASGLLLLPATATLIVLSPISGVLTDRFGPRVPMVAGVVGTAVGVYLLSMIDANSTPSDLVPGLLALGVGFGLEITPVNVAALQAIPDGIRATASGVLIAVGMLGATLGIAVFGTVFGSLGRSDLPSQLRDAGVSASSSQVAKLDTLLTGTDDSGSALDNFPKSKRDRVDNAIDETFASTLSDILKFEAIVALSAVIAAAMVPRRTPTRRRQAATAHAAAPPA